MSTLSHEPSIVTPRPWWIDARDMWTSLAIASIWLAVLGSAAFGPDFRTNDASGGSTTIPSAIIVALFALFATTAVAKYGFGGRTKDN
jgi:hypothetical protein